MAGSGKIDILLLRDAAGVRRYRLSVGWLRVLWTAPLVLVLLLGAALAVANHLRDDNIALAKRNEAMRAELDTAGERLMRLENLEKILRSEDATALETLIGSYNPANPGWWKPQAEERKEAPQKDREAARPDLTRLLSRVDANQAGVDNLRVKMENRRLQLNFDLSNVTPQSGLVGRAEVALVANDASLVTLKPEKDELNFQIQRFKQIAASLALPAKVEPKDIYGLKLSIVDPNGKVAFSQVYPLPKD